VNVDFIYEITFGFNALDIGHQQCNFRCTRTAQPTFSVLFHSGEASIRPVVRVSHGRYYLAISLS
jgi:hypothetical protein